MWHNEGLSDFFGTNALFGGGIETQISDHFRFGADIDFTSKTDEGIVLKYTQFGGFIDFSWGIFGGRKSLIYSELGFKGVFLKGIEGDYAENGKGLGFSVALGVEIPLGRKVILDLGWNSIFSSIDFEGENVNVGSEIFSGGLIFNF